MRVSAAHIFDKSDLFLGVLIRMAVGTMRTVCPVSYTHLDVYKRQHIDCVFPVLHGKNGEDGIRDARE